MPALPTHRAIPASLLLSILAASFSQPVLGGARVAGEIDSLKVEAHDATLGEVFAALSARAGLQIRLPKAADQRVDGTFEGPLHWIVARLLAGRNYIARYSDGAIDIIVLGASGPAVDVTATGQSSSALVSPGRGRRHR